MVSEICCFLHSCKLLQTRRNQVQNIVSPLDTLYVTCLWPWLCISKYQRKLTMYATSPEIIWSMFALQDCPKIICHHHVVHCYFGDMNAMCFSSLLISPHFFSVNDTVQCQSTHWPLRISNNSGPCIALYKQTRDSFDGELEIYSTSTITQNITSPPSIHYKYKHNQQNLKTNQHLKTLNQLY